VTDALTQSTNVSIPVFHTRAISFPYESWRGSNHFVALVRLSYRGSEDKKTSKKGTRKETTDLCVLSLYTSLAEL